MESFRKFISKHQTETRLLCQEEKKRTKLFCLNAENTSLLTAQPRPVQNTLFFVHLTLPSVRRLARLSSTCLFVEGKKNHLHVCVPAEFRRNAAK